VFAFCVAMLGTTLPTPLYPLFEQRYSFGPLVVTVIFAVYAFGVIGLIVFGNLFDRLGRKPLLGLGLGLALSAVSALLLLLAGSLAPVYAARVVSGRNAAPGPLGQWAPHPLRLPFAVDLGLIGTPECRPRCLRERRRRRARG
jgi:MFS family permease